VSIYVYSLLTSASEGHNSNSLSLTHIFGEQRTTDSKQKQINPQREPADFLCETVATTCLSRKMAPHEKRTEKENACLNFCINHGGISQQQSM